ncbi:MAG: glycosyl hydrolase 53 family protein [Nitrososphaeria archaeon]|nr:glycosyl hydrolase 53 family protein [Nitrososphaeria archaeon]
MKIKYLGIVSLILLILLTAFTLSYMGNVSRVSETGARTGHSSYTLPISQRSFYIGLTPTPKNWPNSSFEDIMAAYEETGKIAEVAMVWVEKQGIGEFEVLKQNKVITALKVYGLKPVITFNFATIKIGSSGIEYVIDSPKEISGNISNPEFRSRWVKEAKDIALEFKPDYFSLGNEVNDYFYFHPQDFSSFLNLFDEAKREIKSVSPDTKVFVTLSYNHLIENSQWNMVEELDSHVDLIGLTTYPWKHYKSPEEIPADYYSRIKKYTTKPIAFTEIGWTSSPPSSEKLQSQFLIRFLEITRDLKIEMVNWLFLHEIQLKGYIEKISSPETGTIALKRTDGTEKDIYSLWLDLKELKRA